MSQIGPQIPDGVSPEPVSSSSCSAAPTSTADEVPSTGDDSGLGSMAAHNLAISLMARGMHKEVAKTLADVLFDTKCDLQPLNISDELEETIKVLPHKFGVYLCEQFRKVNVVGVRDVGHYLVSIVGHWRDRVRQQGETIAMAGKLVGGPTREATKALLERTGYKMDVSATERIFGPPPKWPKETQTPICEVRVSQLAPNTYEDELEPYFSRHGELYSLRVVMDPVTGVSNGCAYVLYKQEELAKRSVPALLGDTFKGQTINVSITLANCRLYIGNIPKTKGKQEIFAELQRINVSGATNVLIYPDHNEPRYVNRGFFFVDFVDHETAASAKRLLDEGHVTIFNAFKLYVSWAEGHEEATETELRDVKVAFFRSLPPMIDHTYLNMICSPFGVLEKINRMKDIAFVHFAVREECLAMIAALKGTDHFGANLHVELARPQTHTQRMRKDAFRVQSGGGLRPPHSGAYGLNAAQQWQQDQQRRMAERGQHHPAANTYNVAAIQDSQQQWQQYHNMTYAPQYAGYAPYMQQQQQGYNPYGQQQPQPPPPPPPAGKRQALGDEGSNPKAPKK